MKLLLIITLLFSVSLFAQMNQQNNSANKLNLAYPDYPADDQPEPQIANPMIFNKFDSAAFEKAQAGGKKILLVFTKYDCPGCKAQVPTLAKLLKNSEYKDIEVFQIDYLNQPELNKRFQITGWTILVGFKGTTEISRAPGLKSPSQINKFLKLLI
jgi:thiol-disulfide isomerase/thioredoxin